MEIKMAETPTIDRVLLKEMIACVKREVALRYSVYPKLIAKGKMSEEKAEKEKKLMYLVQISLQKIYDGNVPKGEQQALFNTQLYQKCNYLN